MFLVKDYLVGEIEVKENYKDCNELNSFLLNKEEGKSYLAQSYFDDDLCDIDYYKIEIEENNLYSSLDNNVIVKFELSNQKQEVSKHIDYLINTNKEHFNNVSSLMGNIKFEDLYFRYNKNTKDYTEIDKGEIKDNDIVVLGYIEAECEANTSSLSGCGVPNYMCYDLLFYVDEPRVNYNYSFPMLETLVLKKIPLVK